MLIRIFIFGLIAIAKGPQEATLLLLDEPTDHTAYVAFGEPSCAPKCPDAQVFGHGIQGWILDHNKILLPPATDPDQQKLTYAKGRKPQTTVPGSPGEAIDFTWVPSIPDMLKPSGGKGKAKDECLNRPAQCKPHLTGFMQLTLGELRTCQLIETRGAINGPDAIFGFDFQKNSSSPSVLKQAMASIVALVLPVETARSLTISLNDFNDKPVKNLSLKPAPCDFDQHQQCIDLFVGNITRTDESDPRREFIAPHFAHLFGVLPDTESGTTFAPFLMDQSNGNKAGPEVQPQCSLSIPGVGTRKRKLTRNERLNLFILDVPLSRPLCPPGAVAQ